MLLHFFPNLSDVPVVSYLRKGFESRHFAILIAVLTLLSNLFGLEFPVMYTYMALVILGVLFSDDMFFGIPMVACGYFLFSKSNNPLGYEGTSIFLETGAQIQFWVIASIIALCLTARIIFELITKPERIRLPKFTWGLVALGGAYVLGGLFSSYFFGGENYKGNSPLFGLVEILSLSFFYLYFYFTVDFKRIDKSYFAYLLTVVGFLLIGEVIGMMYYGGFFEFSEEGFNRGNLHTGWGHYNNVAGAMIICLPAPFYYATTKKQGWKYLLLGNLFYLTMLFIQSRGGMVFGTVLFGLCCILTVWKSKERKNLILTESLLLNIVLLIAFLFNEQITAMFMSVLNAGMNDSGRFSIYINGLKQFLDAPIFGNGFYACEAFRWGDLSVGAFLPGRYHNTYVQLLASCGIVGLGAYGFHRYTTVREILTNRNVEKYFLALCAGGLIMTSILDCHFFNFGPGLTYSLLLLFLEIDVLRNQKESKETAEVTEAIVEEETTLPVANEE